MTVRYTRRSIQDLGEIRDYLAKHNPSAAWIVASFIRRSIANLTEWPYRGRATDVEGVRRLVVSNFPYLVYYSVMGRDVVVLRIYHARRRISDD